MILNYRFFIPYLFFFFLSCNGVENADNHLITDKISINRNSVELSPPLVLDSNFYYRSCDDALGCGFLNSFGDTVIPIGKYMASYTDTFKNFANVFTQYYDWIGIDKNDRVTPLSRKT